MKKRIFALIFAAMLTCGGCISCQSDSSSDGTPDISYSRPEQSGKTRNERIKAADKLAESAALACTSALAELNIGSDSTIEGWIDSDTQAATDELEAIRTKTAEIMGTVEEPYSVYIKNGTALAAVSKKIDFYGTYPSGLTHANYENELGDEPILDDAKTFAISRTDG